MIIHLIFQKHLLAIWVSLGFRYESRHESNALLEIPEREREPSWREWHSPGDAKLTSLKRCRTPVQVRLAGWSALYASCIHTWSLVLKQRPPSGFGFAKDLGLGSQSKNQTTSKGLAGRRFVFCCWSFLLRRSLSRKHAHVSREFSLLPRAASCNAHSSPLVLSL